MLFVCFLFHISDNLIFFFAFSWSNSIFHLISFFLFNISFLSLSTFICVRGLYNLRLCRQSTALGKCQFLTYVIILSGKLTVTKSCWLCLHYPNLNIYDQSMILNTLYIREKERERERNEQIVIKTFFVNQEKFSNIT